MLTRPFRFLLPSAERFSALRPAVPYTTNTTTTDNTPKQNAQPTGQHETANNTQTAQESPNVPREVDTKQPQSRIISSGSNHNSNRIDQSLHTGRDEWGLSSPLTSHFDRTFAEMEQRMRDMERHFFGDSSIFRPFMGPRRGRFFDESLYDWPRWDRDSRIEQLQRETQPRFRTSDSKTEWSVSVDLPGVSKSDIDMSIDGETLKITAKREWNTGSGSSEDAGQGERESGHEVYTSSFQIPESADAEGIKGVYVDGVLRVTIPKRKDESNPKIRKIPIDA